MVPRNVAGLARAPRPSATKEISPLSAEEARRFLEAAYGDRLEALYVLAVHTGMRQGELLALKWQDVDLENATLSVRRTITKSGGHLLLGEPKTRKSRRTIDLTEASVEALREHLARQTEEITVLGDRYKNAGLVFTSEVGTLINPTNLRRRSFASLLERAKAASGTLPRPQAHLRHTTLLEKRPPEGCPGASGAFQHLNHAGHLLPRHTRNKRPGRAGNGGSLFLTTDLLDLAEWLR